MSAAIALATICVSLCIVAVLALLVILLSQSDLEGGEAAIVGTIFGSGLTALTAVPSAFFIGRNSK